MLGCKVVVVLGGAGDVVVVGCCVVSPVQPLHVMELVSHVLKMSFQKVPGRHWLYVGAPLLQVKNQPHPPHHWKMPDSPERHQSLQVGPVVPLQSLGGSKIFVTFYLNMPQCMHFVKYRFRFLATLLVALQKTINIMD